MRRKEDRVTIIDSIKFEKSFVPAPSKYKINYQAIESHMGQINYKSQKRERFTKLEKKGDPSPFTYKSDESFFKTQTSKTLNAFKKANIKCFAEQIAKNKSFLPGVGHYKKLEDGYSRLSKPTTSLRRHR